MLFIVHNSPERSCHMFYDDKLDSWIRQRWELERTNRGGVVWDSKEQCFKAVHGEDDGNGHVSQLFYTLSGPESYEVATSFAEELTPCFEMRHALAVKREQGLLAHTTCYSWLDMQSD